MSDRAARIRDLIQWSGLGAGPALALLAWSLLPHSFVDQGGAEVEFTAAGRATLAVMIWMGTWWLTEAIDISATALLPLAVFPLTGIATMGEAAAPFAHELIFLFLGGFLLAISMQRWALDRRIALLTLRLVGTRPRSMVAGFMIATGVLSAFVSNTATTAMMLPIALSIVELVRRQGGTGGTGGTGSGTDDRNFATCLMLGVAYAASIGGVATIIGTPPNVFLAGFVKDTIDPAYRQDISFVRWLGVGVPLAALFMPIAWLLLTRVLHPIRLERLEGGRELVARALRELGPTAAGEKITFLVFCATALAWIFRPLLAEHVPGLSGLSDAGIAMGAAMLLFVLPVDLRTRTFALDWHSARNLPHGILLLFGGGLSLAAAVKANGVAEFLGTLALDLGGLPPLVLVVAVTAGVIFLTELTSNTATTAAIVPILAAIAPSLGLHPYLLIVPATLAASCAFMMPVATPPNAIVFGSGHITIPQMARAGIWLNLIGIVLITVLLYAAVGAVLAI